ncbi:hypothetical protein GYMLUDRAFT_252862 [Collybiopsis luxurians FD-317 M1]|uniref:Uncharacterized protein n=1 Tax=Collybiopsis luxurians FD-317 M1 TaxID=944289 RepID=A0A0D0BYS2_9AGAR|nr:hypothetical protein GYMLUDRAFT_252862 [Collybiopsis luxurians FD-317 M1]
MSSLFVPDGIPRPSLVMAWATTGRKAPVLSFTSTTIVIAEPFYPKYPSCLTPPQNCTQAGYTQTSDYVWLSLSPQCLHSTFNTDSSTFLHSTIHILVLCTQYPPQLRYILVLIETPSILQSPFHSPAYSGIGRKFMALERIYLIGHLAPLVPLFFELLPLICMDG